MKILVLSREVDSPAAQALTETANEKHIPLEHLALLSLPKSGSGVKPAKKQLIKISRELSGSAYKTFNPTERPFARALAAYINESGISDVVCTDLEAVRAAAAAKGDIRSARVYGILTEWMSVKLLLRAQLDGYFIAHEDIKRDLEQRGLKGDRLYSFGLPVSKSFRTRFSKQAARNYLFIPEDRRVYILNLPGAGVEEIRDVADRLIEQEDEPYLIYIILERGAATKERLSAVYRGNPDVRLVTETRKLGVYLESADVLLSKPRAMGSYAAAVAGVPIVHIQSLYASDAATAEFFFEREMSLKGSSADDTVKKARRLVEEKAVGERMVRRQRLNTTADAAVRIIDTIVHLSGASSRQDTAKPLEGTEHDQNN